jgi:hypothetical protein
MTFECFCGKKYIRPDAFARHKTLCQLVYNCDKIEKNIEVKYIPTNRELYIMLLELFKKYDKLQNDYSYLKHYVNKIKKNTNMIEYLNKNFICTNNFLDFISSIDININHIDTISDSNYIKVVTDLLINYIKNNDAPIKCFKKDSYIYIYHNNKWQIIDSEIEKKFYNLLDCKILDCFNYWKLEREGTLDHAIFRELYVKNMNKILISNSKKQEIKNILYKRLCDNIEL